MIDKEQAAGQEEIPLLVDLDGSLIRTDILYETVILLIKRQPWLIVMLPFWLWQGKHVLKRECARRTKLNVDVLPYRTEVVEYLEREYQKGRQIVLCTASWHEIAERIRARFDFFSSCRATDDHVNLGGDRKAAWAVDTYGEKGFDYLGNHEVDLAVWKRARRAIVVGNDPLASQAGKVAEVEHQFPVPRVRIRQIAKAVRVHQWAKNALIFVPLLTAHAFGDMTSVMSALFGFISFGLVASATYILNDLFDLEADRKHPIKSRRPFAAGVMSITSGVALGSLLLLAGIVIGACLTGYFVVALLAYLFLTVFYSFKLKRLQTVDVIVLASLFTLRVIAGAAAISVTLSFWLLSFSMFIFLSLAIVKRVSELVRVLSESDGEGSKISGRGYYTSDVTILQSLGGTAGFMSVLVFALYINSDEVIQLYSHPEILWLMCPVLGYWIMRMWMLAARGQMNEDPISFAITDKNSWFAVIVMGLILGAATYV